MSLNTSTSNSNYGAHFATQSGTKKRPAENDGGSIQRGYRHSISLQPALTPFLDVLNMEYPPSIMQLDQWNQQLAELALHLQAQISQLTPQAPQTQNQLSQSGTTQGPKTTSQMDSSNDDPVTAIPPDACPSDRKHKVRRVYTLDFQKMKNKTVKRVLSANNINADKVILSHVIYPRVDEFIVQDDYINQFMSKLQKMGLVKMCTLNGTMALLAAQGQGDEPRPVFDYGKSIRSVYHVTRGASDSRGIEYLEDLAAEVGVLLRTK